MKTVEELKVLSDAELAAEVARVVMGWYLRGPQWMSDSESGSLCYHAMTWAWQPGKSYARWQEVEDALDRRGLGARYMGSLWTVTGVGEVPCSEIRETMWRLLRAPLRQRCEAACLAAGEESR